MAPDTDTVTLREYFERLWEEHAKVHLEHQAAHSEHQAAHDREHRQAEVTAQADARKLDTRLEGMNQFREELTRLSATFPPSTVVDQRFVALQERMDVTVTALERRYEADLKAQAIRIADLELSRANSAGRAAAFAALGGLAGIGVSILRHFI